MEPMKRKYADYKGVDYSSDNVLLSRSPSATNVWKKYDTGRIGTRPGMTLLGEFGLQIYGVHFFDITTGGSVATQVIVHAGTKLYKWDNYPTAPVMSGEKATVTELFTGMNLKESQSFVINNILFIKDGINYLEYDGTTVSAVVGTIPITANNRTPAGVSYDSDGNPTTDLYQEVNLLQPKRINKFVGDGVSTTYYLDTTDLDASSIFTVTAEIDGITKVEGIDFTVDRTLGTITPTLPENFPKPATDGVANIVVTFSKTISGYADRINKCTLATQFDNRIFFSGNIDYPNTVFHTELNDARYIRDNAYYQEGLDFTPVRDMIAGDDVLWVLKEPNQSNKTIFYHTPTLDYNYGKIYPSKGASISTGCVGRGINFSDDIVFFSDRGMEAINGAINSEKLLAHRSSNIDKGILAETNYDDMKLAEYNGYLLCLVNEHIYLADSRQIFTNELTGELEYEWYYWELPNDIIYMKEIKGTLFLGNAAGKLYSLSGTTDNTVAIVSKWTTPKDNFGSSTVLKTTNKRGGIAEVGIITNGTITIKTKTDNNSWEKLGTYNVDKGYIVYKIKEKKWKEIQLEFSSSNFELFSCTLEAFGGSYIKR